ncbi:hypothetical protein [Spirosoma pollinicola]|uniref:Uncharacterized protein n=1 Tax=Spirosoma pollinicola TaxID=2057025 RepID=A0A2K8Z1V0_9BACT|nr:hypothetical protein [Spirosoma pollinicola]AUD03870.1 hypothetical protein CWM47_19805 [Spirosoma pollinicola]
MTFPQRIRRLFSSVPVSSASVDASVTSSPLAVPTVPVYLMQQVNELITLNTSPVYKPEPLPDWLADENSLRDEGVLFGLSDARPDGKINQIRAFFAGQTASLDELVTENTEKIGELNLLIEHRESRITTLRGQISDLRDSKPTPTNLIRTLVSLLLSVGMCVCNFYLIDETLRPIFPNRLIALGVFLAGMFNLFGRTSFFYEEGTRLSVRRVLAEAGLPLAASVFILAKALETQSVGQAIALFAFTFFLFLLAGSLFLSTLTRLQTDLASIESNRLMVVNKVQSPPVWETEIDRLRREIDAIRMQKWPIVISLNHTQTDMTRLNTKRDELVNLFVSEFELARSLRDRLSEQQRKLLMNYD